MLLGGARGVEGVEGVAGVGDLGGDGDLDEGVTTCKGQSATRSTVCIEQPCSYNPKKRILDFKTSFELLSLSKFFFKIMLAIVLCAIKLTQLKVGGNSILLYIFLFLFFGFAVVVYTMRGEKFSVSQVFSVS